MIASDPFVAKRLRRILTGFAVMAAIGLTGCETVGTMGSAGQRGDVEDSQTASTDIASLSDVVTKNPGDAEAYNMRGSAYARSGQYEAAAKDFDQALRINPGFAQARANRALVYRKTNRPDLALADYNAAIQASPTYAQAYVGRGNIYRQQGQTEQAMADYDHAIQIKPETAEAYYNRGLIHQQQSQPEIAIDDFTSAISTDPLAPEPYLFARHVLSGDQEGQGSTGGLQLLAADRQQECRRMDRARPGAGITRRPPKSPRELPACLAAQSELPTRQGRYRPDGAAGGLGGLVSQPESFRRGGLPRPRCTAPPASSGLMLMM